MELQSWTWFSDWTGAQAQLQFWKVNMTIPIWNSMSETPPYRNMYWRIVYSGNKRLTRNNLPVLIDRSAEKIRILCIMRSYEAIKIIRHPSIHLGQPHVVCTSKLKKGSYFREKNKSLECGLSLSLCLFSLSLPHFTVFFSHICDSWTGPGSATLLGLAHALPACCLANSYSWFLLRSCLKPLFFN